MRKLASFEDPTFADALREVLHAADIESELRPGEAETRALWIMSEADVPRALTLLREFAAEPDHDRFENARNAARDRRLAAEQPASPARPNVAATRTRQSLRARASQAPVNVALLFACIAVAFATQFGERADIVSYFSIVSFQRAGGFVHWSGYADILHGQIWRLFTPILIHFGAFHLIFNALWLNDLGAATERYQGSWRFFLFVLFSAAVSNLAQLQFGMGPNFGGLSGVIYALVGYLWARGRADPSSGIALPNRLVGFFVAWMLLGFSGLVSQWFGQMANYCHLGGFAAGALYGYIAAVIARRRARH
jgi:GlpG protein